MDSEQKNTRDDLINRINELTAHFNPRDYRKHKILILEGIIERLIQLSGDCSECARFFSSFEQDFVDKLINFDHANQREYHFNLKKVLYHLRNKHKIVTAGYYTETYMSVGMAVGLPLGLAMGNIAIGFIMGLSVGLAVGTGMDKSAKKSGNVILIPENNSE